MVSSSEVVLRTCPPVWSTRTSTSAMVCESPWTADENGRSGRSDELALGQEGGELLAAVTLVGHDLALGARRARRIRLDLGPRGVEPDLARLDPEVGERPGVDRLLLR